MPFDSQLPGLLALVVSALAGVREEMRGFDALSKKLTEQDWHGLLPESYSRAVFYELTHREHMILALASLGLLSKYVGFDWSSPDWERRFLEIGLDVLEDESFFNDWPGGDGGMFSQADVVSLVLGMLSQMQSVSTYGAYLSDLVQFVEAGDDGALFKAVVIDKCVVGCQTVARRIERASCEGDRAFFRLLGASIARQPKKHWRSYDDLRVLLKLCQELGTLDDLTQTDADKLFIQQLKVYSDGGKDPSRSLFRFIQRWKAETRKAT